jgi:hypothetical protein
MIFFRAVQLDSLHEVKYEKKTSDMIGKSFRNIIAECCLRKHVPQV